jgi:dihydrofolate reductase
LKEQEGGDILVAGSASLVQGLMARGLVDEFRLMTFPVVLGSGKRLFGELDDLAALKLADSKVLDSGTLILTYVRA